METRFQTTSFIPKTSLDNIVSEDGRLQNKTHSNGASIVTLICFFLFVASLVSAGVVFFLSKLADASKDQAQKQLSQYQEKNTTQTILELRSLQDRLSLIDSLIKEHVAISPIFDTLAKNTLSLVSFSSFDIKKKNDNSFTLSLKAQGVGYESIVAQDNQFSLASVQKTFKNTSITDFSKPKGQDITTFGVNTTVANSAVNFVSLLSNDTLDSNQKSSNINTAI